jgi:hypothetical protein
MTSKDPLGKNNTSHITPDPSRSLAGILHWLGLHWGYPRVTASPAEPPLTKKPNMTGGGGLTDADVVDP